MAAPSKATSVKPVEDLELRVTEAAKILSKAARPLKILRHLDWPEDVGHRFFSRHTQSMPEVRYPKRDASAVLEGVAEARRWVPGSHPAERWLRRQAKKIELGARMVSEVNTPTFHRLSVRLYGAPREAGVDGTTTSLQLAKRLDRLLSRLDPDDLGTAVHELSPAELAKRMRVEVRHVFGAEAPTIELVDHLSAKAVAAANKIRLHAKAGFDDADLTQLVSHEAMIHVLTRKNGKHQTRLPVLGTAHPGTTRTQEGLAVFSELITGSMTPRRFRRLANRVLAIDLSMQGADFIEVYRFFLDQTDDPWQSFEDARRVFRGGVLTGGAPFTKDGVYLDGLVRVHNFLRAAVELRRVDLIGLLFVGRMNLDDIVVLSQLRRRRMVRKPKFLPPWVVDRRFLIAYLAYSGFLNQVGLPRVRAHYEGLLSHAEVTDAATPGSRG